MRSVRGDDAVVNQVRESHVITADCKKRLALRYLKPQLRPPLLRRRYRDPGFIVSEKGYVLVSVPTVAVPMFDHFPICEFKPSIVSPEQECRSYVILALPENHCRRSSPSIERISFNYVEL